MNVLLLILHSVMEPVLVNAVMFILIILVLSNVQLTILLVIVQILYVVSTFKYVKYTSIKSFSITCCECTFIKQTINYVPNIIYYF